MKYIIHEIQIYIKKKILEIIMYYNQLVVKQFFEF